MRSLDRTISLGFDGNSILDAEQGNWLKIPNLIQPGYVNSLLLNMAIDIVDLPIENGDFP